MTPLLARAFAAASRLPLEEQDALAAFMLATINDRATTMIHERLPADGGDAGPLRRPGQDR